MNKPTSIGVGLFIFQLKPPIPNVNRPTPNMPHSTLISGHKVAL